MDRGCMNNHRLKSTGQKVLNFVDTISLMNPGAKSWSSNIRVLRSNLLHIRTWATQWFQNSSKLILVILILSSPLNLLDCFLVPLFRRIPTNKTGIRFCAHIGNYRKKKRFILRSNQKEVISSLFVNLCYFVSSFY